MPIYVYQPVSEQHCRFCEFGFEFLQRLRDAALDSCPECGAPVARTVTAPNLSAGSPSLDENTLGKHGFTQYRKLEKGVY